MSVPAELLAEYDETEQQIADGVLCPETGEPHDWQEYSYRWGEDADGNRGVWCFGKRCLRCGEER